MKNFIAAEDGVLVRRIKSAGAVILGKTNVPANLQGYQCKGDIYPEGKNPHRLQCSPGGSTGGGAAAVAAGMTALELGADGGGSLRVPAHFCGVVCLKPTDKTIVRYGGMPLPKEPHRFLVNMGQPGPLGRSIDDLELLWQIIRGPDPSDFEIAPIDWHPPSGRSLAELRVAWTDGFEPYIAGAKTREQLGTLAARIETAGARVEKAAPAIHPRGTEVFVQLQGNLLGQNMAWLLRKIFPLFVARGPLKGQPHMVRLLRRALKIKTQDYAATLGLKRDVRIDAAGPAYAAAVLSIVALVVTVAVIVPNTRAVVHISDENVAPVIFDHLTLWWKGKAALHVATFVANVLSLAKLRRS